MPGGAAGAEGGLELVGTEGILGKVTDTQEHGDGDQAAAAGDRVDEAGEQAGGEKQAEDGGFHRGKG